MIKRTTLLTLICSLWSIGVPAASDGDQRGTPGPDRKCKQIDAKLASVRVAEHCGSPVDFCAAGVISGDELIAGTFRASAFGFVSSVGLPGVEPETTLSYAGDRTVDTRRGTLTLRFTGVFDTARAEFSELERVETGTGRFEGATGTIWVIGQADATATAFEGRLLGHVCLAR